MMKATTKRQSGLTAAEAQKRISKLDKDAPANPRVFTQAVVNDVRECKNRESAVLVVLLSAGDGMTYHSVIRSIQQIKGQSGNSAGNVPTSIFRKLTQAGLIQYNEDNSVGITGRGIDVYNASADWTDFSKRVSKACKGLRNQQGTERLSLSNKLT